MRLIEIDNDEFGSNFKCTPIRRLSNIQMPLLIKCYVLGPYRVQICSSICFNSKTQIV